LFRVRGRGRVRVRVRGRVRVRVRVSDVVQRELQGDARRACEVLRCRRAHLEGVRVRGRGRRMG